MKTTAILLLFTLFIAQPQKHQNKFVNPVILTSSIDESDLKGMQIRKDDFENSVTVTAKNVGYSTKLVPYLKIDNNKLHLFLTTRHYSSSWVFMQTATLMINSETITYNVEKNTSIVSGGTVSETSNILIDEEIYQHLKKISSKKDKVKLRLSGEFKQDYTLQPAEVNQILKVLDKYELLINKYTD